MRFTVSVMQRGLTLLELVVVMALVGVLAGVGFPAFAAWVDQHRLTGFTNELHMEVMLARSEAIRRGQRVTLCVSADGEQCTFSAGWEVGWIMFLDRNGNAVRDPGEDIIRMAQPTARGLQATGNGTLARYVSYIPKGMTRSATGALQMGTIRVCGQSGQRQLVINAAGRPRVLRGEACV